MSSSTGLTISSSMQHRRTVVGGVFDTMLAAKLGYNATSLALIDYGVQFTKARAFKDSDKFVGGNGREFTTNFFGQISSDFTAHPTGNYTSPGEGPFVPINDSTRVKFVVGLECPTYAPPKMRAMFANQLATLGNIISHDSQSSKQTRIKSWVSSSNDGDNPDKLFFTSAPLYKASVPYDRRYGGFKTKVEVDVDNEPGAPPVPHVAAEPNLGDTYPCSIWPGYGGPRFNHQQARAVQLNLRDPQGRLIRPEDTYLWLAPGAIVVVHATMHVYRFARMTIFQLSAASIQVIDKTDMLVPVPTVLGLPIKSNDVPINDAGDVTPQGAIVDFASMLNTGGDIATASTSSKLKHDMDFEDKATTSKVDEGTEVVDEDVEMDAHDPKGLKREYNASNMMDLALTSRDLRRIVKCVADKIDNNLYSSSALALFVGNWCDTPVLVPAPVVPGVQFWRSVDELDVRMYIWTSNQPGLKNCNLNRIHVDRFPPSADTALKRPLTFYFEPENTPTSRSVLMRRKVRPYPGLPVPPLRGNVLVIKHDREGVVDMEKKDWPLVKVILEWLMVHRGDYADVRPPIFATPYLLRPIVENQCAIRDHSQENQASIRHATNALRRHPLWRVLDLRWTVFESMGILTLFSLSGTCRTMRRWVRAFYRARVSRMLSNAFEDKHHAAFLDTLEEFDGKIGGSAAYSVADPCAPIVPNDINIMVPYGSGRSLCCELKTEFGCTGQTAGNEDLIRDRFDTWLNNFYVLHTPMGFKLTISESETSSHLPLMLAGYSTAECVLLGRQNFTVMFPSLIEHGDVISMHAMGYTIPADVSMRLRRRWALLESTEELNRPCGECCPRLLRRSFGHRQCATLKWGGYSKGAESEIQWGSYEWKISFDCHNFFCDNPRPLEMSRWLCWEERDVEEEEQEEEGEEQEDEDGESMDTYNG
ncbi:hypothetical protein FB446DRAFT_788305 [Lentinula raphanica]|nr:hypothetical protein FB446DRAFT_788305 [Lentinula raphanica]